MARDALQVLLAVALLAGAGCVGLAADGSPTAADPTLTDPTAASAPADRTTVPPAGGSGVTVVGGDLSVDTDRVFDRVAAMLGVDPAPPTVEVRSADEMTASTHVPPFLARLGVAYDRETVAVAASTGGGTVSIRRDVTAADRLPYVLAHEFTHVAQQGPQNASRRFYTAFDEDEPAGLDRRLLARSVLEGGATLAGQTYWERHVGESPTPAARLERGTRAANSSGERYTLVPYYVGYRYLDRRGIAPADLGGVYADPPRTTEELLHGHPPGSEPTADLTVSASVDGWERGQRGRVGELATRLALRTELNRSRAAAAADGWGDDRRLAFERDGATGHVWALRWDDPANASEFETAFRTYLDRRATRTDGAWRDDGTAFRLRRTGPRTTVVVLGDPAFVSGVAVSGTESVTVTDAGA